MDDPQNREAAFSKIQTEQRLAILNGDVLGMAGPGQTIAAVVPCTVIAPGDMADQLLNRDKCPQWQGERTKMVYAFPTDEKLWQEYREMRDDSFRSDGDGQRGHRALPGASGRNGRRGRSGMAPAIQRRRVERRTTRDEPTFPKRGRFHGRVSERPQAPGRLPARWSYRREEIRRKVNGRQPGEVPKGCECLTAFIDVHDDLLFWAVCGWESDFTGYGIEYGAFPEQSQAVFHAGHRAADPTAAIRRGRERIGHLRRARILRSGLAGAQLHARRRQHVADRPPVDRLRLCPRNRP